MRLVSAEGVNNMTVWFPASGDLRLAADVEGAWNGVPVLLLHGGGQTRHSWKSTASMLAAEGYFVITVDQRGHGESDWAPDGAYELDDYANDVRQLARAHSRPCVLVGASLGGLASLLAAGEDPAIDCAAVVLVDITPRMSADGRARIRSFMQARPDGFETVDEAADAVAAYLPHRSRPRDLEGLRKNLRVGSSGRLHWHWDPTFLSRLHNDSRDVPRLEAALAAINAPKLLVRGLLSDVVTDESTAAFQAIAPAAEYVQLPDAAHMVASDRNDVFSDAVSSFLRRVAPARGTATTPGASEGDTCVSA
jgi:non-heme chloroperoxidase